MPLQLGERVQRLGNTAQIPLGNGREQQRIPVTGSIGEQRFSRG
jgi:hypothetical protein